MSPRSSLNQSGRSETTKNSYGHLFAQDWDAILTAMNQAVTRLYVQDDLGQAALGRVGQVKKEQTPGIGPLGVLHFEPVPANYRDRTLDF